MNYLAQNDGIPLSPDGEGFSGVGKGPLSFFEKNYENAGEIFNNLISTVVGIITVVAFIWFVFLFLTGALGIMTAGGDKAKVEASRQRLTNGIVGLVIVVAAIFIVDLIGGLLGIENILNPAELIEKISPGGGSGK